MKIRSVILSGGMGSRLWPLSRESYPKQFLPLVNEQTLLQETALRASSVDSDTKPLVVCSEQHRFIMAAQLQAIGFTPEKILLEPMGRNTAPAIALAAFYQQTVDPDTALLVMPSDHVIIDESLFKAAVSEAWLCAVNGYLVTFGIKPTSPEVGYGYIQCGENLQGHAFKVSHFIEKPSLDKAKGFLQSRDYYWNSGIFLFTAKHYLAALQQCATDLYEACQIAYSMRAQSEDFMRFDADLFAKIPAISIDYAVMEKAENLAMVGYEGRWSDIGSWSGLHKISSPDEKGNVAQGDVISLDTKNSYLRAESRMLVVNGVENLVVVETDDAVLVSDKNHCQDIKNVVAHLKKLGRDEHKTHKKNYRPWGFYESLISGPRFQVKRITVNPGGRLSLQKHYHRSEHWVVVDGTALVTREDEQFLLTENQSTYIPVGILHRLENPGKTELHIIEVQSGGYLDEDDVVRVTDDYGRALVNVEK